jgi:DNA-binding IclR family transcriptional regulator
MTAEPLVAHTGSSCRSVRNAFRLLELLSANPDGMRLARLVDGTGLPKSSVHRILGTLQDMGIVWRDEDDGVYHLTGAWREVVSPRRRSEFSAPVLSHDGRQVAGLTLRLRGQVSPGASSDRLTRLVADLAHAVSRRIRP